MDYEAEQSHIQKLWELALSDEEEDLFCESPDEYVPSDQNESSDDSDEEISTMKRIRKFHKVTSSKKCKRIIDKTDVEVTCTLDNANKSPPMDCDPEMETIEQVIRDYSVDAASSEADEVSDDNNTDLVWNDVTGTKLKQYSFTNPSAGIKVQIYESYYNKHPIDFYEIFINDNIINMMVLETNRYASQCKAKETAPKARIHQWCDVDIAEMRTFIGILIWMGLCQYPCIESYWSTNLLYQNKIKLLMSRNRFQLILKMWYFHDNEVITGKRLQKIIPLLDMLIDNFQAPVIPKESICIDETLVPFRGRLNFKQFIKNKRHKFGIKIYKLCLEKGHTYNVIVYCGQDKVEGQSSSENVVLILASNLLNEGRTIYTDNYYTSVAHTLLDKKTHLVGTLRLNRKFNPKNVTQRKLKKGETVAAESNSSIVIQKWRDKRDVLTLSTKHTSELVKITYGTKETEKPCSVIDYNKHKAYIDLSDQMKAYNTCLRKGVKWYRKLAVELLTGTALVNAFVLHQEVANEKMSITKFKEMVVTKLLNLETQNDEQEIDLAQHILQDAGRRHRGRCVGCYKKLTEQSGRIEAQAKTPRVKLRCMQCAKNYCMPCFFEIHKCTK